MLFRSKNLGIAISEKGLQDLKTQREIDAPADHFRSRTIQVVGVVVVREDRVYIDVHKASQINEIQTSAD